MTTTKEWCEAATALVSVARPGDLANEESDFYDPMQPEGTHALGIDNWCSHLYVVAGTLPELRTFVERLSMLVDAMERGQNEHRHGYQGQTLVHSHPHDADHGYFEHPEDPRV